MHPELLDIIDKLGNRLGYSLPRDEVHKTEIRSGIEPSISGC